jgi:hypothetical protein
MRDPDKLQQLLQSEGKEKDEAMLFGLTFFEAMCRAIVSASLVNTPFFGYVDAVATFPTPRFSPFLEGISTLNACIKWINLCIKGSQLLDRSLGSSFMLLCCQ